MTSSGHIYQDISITGSSRIHVGNVYQLPRERVDKPQQPLSTVPYRRIPHYVQDVPLFQELCSKLSRPAARVALVGVGGIGKTQLAVEYAYHLRDKSPETWILWISASNEVRLEQSVRGLLGELRIRRRDDLKANTFELLHSWLRDASNGPWLVILDNADHPDFLFEAPYASEEADEPDTPTRSRLDYFPSCDHGNILVTSRSRRAAVRLGCWEDFILIEPMKEEQALALLRTKLGEWYIEESALQLAQAVEFMPLALAQAAAYMCQEEGRYSIQQYLEKMGKAEANVFDLDERGLRRHREASNQIMLTCEISFDHIRQIRPSAAALLSLMSFFDHEAIPEALLQRRGSGMEDGATERGGEARTKSLVVAGKSHDEDHSIASAAARASNNGGFHEDLLVLRSFHLVKVTTDPRVFEMHPIVQSAVKRWLKANKQLARWRTQFIINLDEAIPIGSFENREQCHSLFTHANIALQTPVTGRQAILRRASLLLHGGQYARLIGAYGVAERMGEQSLEARTMVLGPEHPDTLTSKANLASTYQDQKQYDKAAELEEQVLETRRKILGSEHPATLTSMSNLAVTYSEQGQIGYAEVLQDEVLEERKQQLGETHPDTLVSMTNLALNDSQLGLLEHGTDLEDFQRAKDLALRVANENLSSRSDTDAHSRPESVFSLGPVSTTSMSSAMSLNAWPIERFVDALFLNDEIKVVNTAAFSDQMIDYEAFQRNFRRLVIRFGANLRSESRNKEQRVAGRLIQLKAADIAGVVAHATGVKSHNERTRQFASLKSFPEESVYDKLARTLGDPPLQDLDSAQSQGTRHDKHASETAWSEDRDSVASASADEEPEDDGLEAQPFGEFASLRDFILASHSYQGLKDELVAFVCRNYTKRIENVLRCTPRDNAEAKHSRQELQSFASEFRWLSSTDVNISFEVVQTWTNSLKAFVEDTLGESWNWWPLKARVQPIPRGYARVRWSCACGDERHVDLPVTLVHSLQKLLRPVPPWVNSRATAQESPAPINKSATTGQGKTSPLPDAAKTPSPSSAMNTNQSVASSGTTNAVTFPGTTPGATSNTTSVVPTQQVNEHVFLVARRGMDFDLLDIDVQGFSDVQFFRALKQGYTVLRGNWRLYLSWWRFDHCEFFRFQKFAEQSFVPRKAEYPHKDNVEYRFLPRPMEPDPPITKHEFHKRFYNTCSRPSSWHLPWHRCLRFCTRGDHALAVIPKRLSPLEKGYDKREEFWSIFAQERRSFFWVFCYFLVAISPSLAFFFLWLFPLNHGGDLQNASVPATLTIALLSILASVLWNDREVAWLRDWA